MTPLSFYPLLEVKEEVRFDSDSSEFWREFKVQEEALGDSVGGELLDSGWVYRCRLAGLLESIKGRDEAALQQVALHLSWLIQ